MKKMKNKHLNCKKSIIAAVSLMIPAVVAVVTLIPLFFGSKCLSEEICDEEEELL